LPRSSRRTCCSACAKASSSTPSVGSRTSRSVSAKRRAKRRTAGRRSAAAPPRRSSPPATTLLFVYGSLKSGRRAHSLVRTSPGARWIGNGWIAGRLFDLGDHPGAVLVGAGAHRVYGELWRLERGPAVFQRLDAYEGVDTRT